MLSVAETDLFLSTPKRAVSLMDWRPSLSKKDAQWWKWDSAIEVDGIVPEGTRVILQWRPAIGTLTELFGYFCHKANLTVDGGFKPPPSQQLSLELK